MAKKYTTIQGDTWDLISYKVYGDEKYIEMLMKANYELLDYVVFPAGVKINVPALPNVEENNNPEWRSIDE